MARAEQQAKSSLQARQTVNKWCARIIPVLLVGAVGYATWVMIAVVCVHYFLSPGPSTHVPPRPGAAIAVMIIYFLLLIPTAVAYFRVVTLVRLNPGYTPIGPASDSLRRTFVEEPSVDFEWPCCAEKTGADEDAPAAEKKRARKTRRVPGWYIHTLDLDAIFRGDIAPPPGMRAFYSRDVFQCDPNGLPIWCGTCRNWKPDRAHHCSDVGRCALKLDHFCPWVGGVVGENNFKFFVQFNAYTALFTSFVTIVMAIAIAEQVKKGQGSIHATWIILIALAVLFLLFTGGLFGKCLQDTLNGLTTVDAIDASKRTVFMAVKLKRGQKPPVQGPPGENGKRRDIGVPWQGTVAYPFQSKEDSNAGRPRETFAILCTPPGLNPWNLGPLGNWRSVMGNRWVDWFVPLKMSPCCDHSSLESAYELGSAFKEFLVDAGIEEAPQDRTRSRRRRKDRSEHQHQRRRGDSDIEELGNGSASSV